MVISLQGGVWGRAVQRLMIRENELNCVVTESAMREKLRARLVCSLASLPQFRLLYIMQIGGLEVQ